MKKNTHKNADPGKHFLVAGGIILLFASCNSCNQSINVTADTHDTTPPIVIWTIKNNTQGTEKTFAAGNAVYNDANTNDELVVSAVASDNGGLKEVDDWVAVSYQCGDGESVSNVSSVSETHKVPINIVSGKTLPSWPVSFAAMNFSLDCQSDYHFISGGYAFICEVTNAANLKTQSSLSVNGRP